ncbi:MAG: glutamate 5-kinase [Desulfurivibrionaceae bacterium]|nr:glutamate 5-kinase [Desulfobulbales bacterium]MDT8334967.1 glutamate 5-kinase [Desulfurivibrionaceae bacterium]
MTFQVPSEEGLKLRRDFLGRAKRVVVKVGSAVLTGEDGLDQAVIDGLLRQLAALRRQGREVILVSSGAVAAGRRKLRLSRPVIGIKEKQAAAAVGQSNLMRVYEDIAARYGQMVAQILLTHDDLANRDRYLNVRNTLFTLLGWGIIPIINENDTVSVEELRFGDNDNLGGMITNLIEADIFICLTDVEALFTGNPFVDPAAERVLTVRRIDRRVEEMAGNVASALGTGGMQSKIRAAKMVATGGGSSFIGPGRHPEVLDLLFAGEPIGTFFLPKPEKMQSRKHWIAYTLKPKGELVLDRGACRALVENGKSLLPSGIVEVRGCFGVGVPVHCLDETGRAVAAGLVNYNSADLDKLKGARTGEIEARLGFKDSDEVIHRDNLVIL